MKLHVSLLTVFLSLAACGLSLLAWLNSNQACNEASVQDHQFSKMQREMSETIKLLKQEQAQAFAQIKTTPSDSQPDEGDPQPVSTTQLHEWVWALDQRMKELETASRPSAPTMDISQARLVAVDTGAQAGHRLAALALLRAADARSPEVVRSMLALQKNSPDPRVRAGVFRHLEGVTDPGAKAPMMEAATRDGNAEVREEAVESLTAFRNAPDVLALLQRIASQDPDDKVRRMAQRLLVPPDNP